MVNCSIARIVSAFVLCCALTLVPVSFSSASAASFDGGRVSPFANLTDLLGQLWDTVLGGSAERNGVRSLNPATTSYTGASLESDGGAGINPDGFAGDGGAGINPDGFQGDGGAGINPDG